MKAFAKIILPRIVGVLFAVQAILIFCTQFNLLNVLLRVPVLVLLAIVLLLRKRDTPLSVGAVLLALVRLGFTSFLINMPHAAPYWLQILAPALAGELLLMAFVLVNTVPKLKKFRSWANYLWFLPGAAALITVMVCSSFDVACYEVLNSFGLGIWEMLGVVLLPLWLACAAEDDLLPYQEMLGSIITPEQLEEKKRELGLAGRGGK